MSPKDENILLGISRNVLRKTAANNKVGDDVLEGLEITEPMKKNFGVFVTLKMTGELRGCIGNIEPVKPLYRAVMDNTVNSACRDPRFAPVQVSEVDSINIGISVLSPPEEIPDISSFEVGTHGIILKKGGASAVFLPQVAPEQGWDREETLRHLSRKAGLGQNDWKEKDAQFEVFTAQVFQEE